MTAATVIATTPLHISSFVVHCLPEQLNEVTKTINSFEHAEVSIANPVGKLVVLLESESEKKIMDVVADIEAIKGVITATMVYHQID
jgi:nitrate reductase NapD